MIFFLKNRVLEGLTIMMILCLTGGCAMGPKQLRIKGSAVSYSQGTIIDGKTGAPVSFEALLKDLATVRIVYVGESHTDPSHHAVQLKVIEALHGRHTALSVGMEMFDPTYQPKLDAWSAGKLDTKTFLEQVHWAVNWRYDFNLYKAILAFAKTNHIKLVGLNIPFHIPRKIRIGGIDSLPDADKRHLARTIDLSNAAHRAYLEKIFKQHHFNTEADFKYFYEAQCAWEDTMAESIARNLGGDIMVVLAGRGHIERGFGIPDRAFSRTGVPFRTIVPVSVGETAELSVADYLWVTPDGHP